MNADDKFVESVIGLEPDPNKHDYVLHFEPVIFAFKKKIDLNFV